MNGNGNGEGRDGGLVAGPGADDNPPLIGEEADLPFWEIAAQIREERPRWAIIWLSRERRFRAYPKFRPPAGMTSASGHDRAELLADMDRIEEAARPQGRAARTTPADTRQQGG